MNDPWVTTFSGRQLFITRATEDDIYIEDIAHGLSNICRYTGQCKRFYSVAEHSVRMAELCFGTSMKLLALLHDSPEAYLNDLNTNVKQSMPEYQKMELYLIMVIFGKYGIGCDPSYTIELDGVKNLDGLIRTPEVISLFPIHPGWELRRFDYGRIRPWSHRKAEKKFLKMFRRLHEHT